MNYERYKRVVIREELVILTEHWLSALILGQFIYWSERTGEFDKFLEEENERYKVPPDQQLEPTQGWIYKSMKQLKEEIMVDLSEGTLRNRTKELVKSEWLHERRNPNVAWDRTIQYRPNLDKILSDLAVKGYILDGYKFRTRELQSLFEQIASAAIENAIATDENGDSTGTNGIAADEKHYHRLQQRLNKDNKALETSSTKDPEYLKNAAEILAGRDADISKQKTDKHNQSTLDAINNGAKDHTDMRDRWYNCFLSRPNWDTKTNGKSLRFLIERDKAGQAIERFAEWWNSDDWRKDKALPPVPSKVKELWAQAFDKPSEREQLEVTYPNMAGAYD